MEVTHVEQRAYVKKAVLRERNAMECHSELVEALGINALPYRTVARWLTPRLFVCMCHIFQPDWYLQEKNIVAVTFVPTLILYTSPEDYSGVYAIIPTKGGSISRTVEVAAVAEWYRYRTGACLVTSLRPVPLKTHHVGQRCTLNLSRAETSFRWCGVVVRRGRCHLRCRPRHLTMVQNYVIHRQKP
ncbi:uncharacterized protein TNCV_3768161 [Trichonephila clavipes]|nr:uncharacterized protein TNCV_3768161 [Trichonephila clavipes]